MNLSDHSHEYTDCRNIDWEYVGQFLKFGKFNYICPKTGKPSVYECVQRTTKNQAIDGVLIIPFIIGSAFKEPSILLIKGYRPAVDGYTFGFPAGLVDKGETPEETAVREMKEETGYSCELAEVQLPIPFFCDPWKSNEQQCCYVAIVDMDKEENKHPQQELEETESINPFIVPLSSLDSFIKDQSKQHIISSSVYIVSSVLCKNSLFNNMDQVIDSCL